ncbi:MAG: hypothetical protein QM769_01860 [Pseudoxanthomonas sp.]
MNTSDRATHICQLWGYINQLETVLQSAVDELTPIPLSKNEEHAAGFNRGFNLLMAAQTIAESLAKSASVR